MISSRFKEATPHARRLGLVLAGGGALGAYQFGCLLAMKEAGIKFCVVTGTSVGALNAALWSFDRMDEGGAFWKSITYAQVYPPKSRLLRNLSPKFYHVLLTVQVAFSLVAGALKRTPYMPEYEPTRRYFVTFNAALLSLSASYVTHVSFGTAFVSHTMLAILMSTFIFMLIVQNPSGRRSTGIAVFYVGVLALGVIFQYVLSGAFVDTLWAILIILAVWRLIYSADHFAFLDSSPLGAAVSEILGSKLAAQPTYVTSATCEEIFDPLTCQFDRQLPSMGPMGVDLSAAPARHTATTERRWLPKYTDLKSQASLEMVSQSLLASAALPFGIVDPVTQKDDKHVDGGVCDNEPVAPIVKLELDEIWLIHVRPYDSEELKERISENIAANSRYALLAELEIPSNISCASTDLHDEIERHPELAAYRAVPNATSFRPDLSNLETLAPTSKLGKIFNGILKFEGPFCHELMKRGKRDAEAFLAKKGI